MRWAILAGLVAVAATVAAGASPSAYADDHRHPHSVFVIRSPQITESSSLVVSTTRRGLAYTANDSGDGGTVYVLDTSTGAIVGRTTLAGVDPVDVEAMAACADGSLVVADIGDNAAIRSTVAVYRLAQPGRGRHVVSADRLMLRYVGGPRDAESVLCDSNSGRVFVISKQALSAAVYATPADAFKRERAALRPVASAPGGATDATMLPGGSLAVIRTYVGAALYRYPSWRLVHSIPLPQQRQGESVAAPGTHVLWVGSEGAGSSVLAVPLPRLPGTRRSTAQPTDAPVASPGETAPPQPGGKADEGMDVPSAATVVVCSGLAMAGLVWLLGRDRRARARRG